MIVSRIIIKKIIQEAVNKWVKRRILESFKVSWRINYAQLQSLTPQKKSENVNNATLIKIALLMRKRAD